MVCPTCGQPLSDRFDQGRQDAELLALRHAKVRSDRSNLAEWVQSLEAERDQLRSDLAQARAALEEVYSLDWLVLGEMKYVDYVCLRLDTVQTLKSTIRRLVPALAAAPTTADSSSSSS